jgi:7-cyano-7-deazaguanine synthase in queuosine biosynthesis
MLDPILEFMVLREIAKLAEEGEAEYYCSARFISDVDIPCGECDECKLHEALELWRGMTRDAVRE